MKDLEKLINICQSALDSLGIKYSKNVIWSVNTRAKSRWGLCKKTGLNKFEISIAVCLLNDNVDDQMAKNTIVHELLHTVSGCMGHKGKWKLLADYVNQKLPQYSIKRVTNFEEKGMESPKKEVTYRYILRCKNCGVEIGRQRMSKGIKNYKNYRCSKCRGELERIK